MKNHFIIKGVRNALLMQLLFPVLLLAVFTTILLRTPTDNFYNPRPLNYKSRYENFYNEALPHVTVTVPSLEYSGLDYVVNGRVRGRYYYTLVNDFCQFYLLSADIGQSPELGLEKFTLKGRLVKLGNIEYEALLKNMASQLNWTAKSLDSISSSYVVSTIPYPFYLNYLYYITLYGGIMIALADIIYLVVNLIKPLGSPALRYLGLPALGKKNVLRIESQLKCAFPGKSKDLFLVPGYFVSTNLSNTMVLPLNIISQIYYKYRKHLITGLFFPASYVLCVTIIGGKTYEFPNYKEEHIRSILTEFKRCENLSDKVQVQDVGNQPQFTG